MPSSRNIKLFNKILHTGQVKILLFFAVGLLITAMLADCFSEIYWKNSDLNRILHVFSTKGAMPTGFLFLLLLACSFLLALISRSIVETADNHDAWYWRVLSLIFFFFSLDELIEIHHRIVDLLDGQFEGIDWSSHKWVFVYAPFVLVFGISYLQFLKGLPKKTRNLFVMSGTITLLGAYLLEIPLDQIGSLYSADSFAYGLFAVLKRSFELFGIVLFTYALLLYIEQNLKDFHSARA